MLSLCWLYTRGTEYPTKEPVHSIMYRKDWQRMNREKCNSYIHRGINTNILNFIVINIYSPWNKRCKYSLSKRMQICWVLNISHRAAHIFLSNLREIGKISWKNSSLCTNELSGSTAFIIHWQHLKFLFPIRKPEDQ